MAKNQLHQLLAVEPDLTQKAAKIANETAATFASKADHFDGHVREYLPFVEPDNPLMRQVPEIKEIVSTVQAKLDYTAKAITAAIDAKVSKEQTNSSGTAKATVSFGDTSVELSATALLAIEGWLTKIRGIYDQIPTLDPAKHWEQKQGTPHVYEASARDAFKTEKVAEPIVLHPPTKEHPAQTELVTMDKNVGIVRTVSTSGRVTPAEKSEMLGRIDRLLVIVKKARSKANQTDVEQIRIGRALFEYIHAGNIVEEEDSE